MVNEALAASGATSADPVAETLTVRGGVVAGDTTVVAGEHPDTRRAAAAARTISREEARRIMAP
jgi:hypothetical protein